MAKDYPKNQSYLKFALCTILLLPNLLWAKPAPDNKEPDLWSRNAVSDLQWQYAHYAEEKHRHRTLDELNAEERKKVIKRRKDFESLPKEKKEKIRKAKKRYQELPAQKRQALKNKWDKMTAEEKKAYLKKLEKQRK